MSKVYLIGIPEESRYKIGYTNRSIDNRVNEIQTGNAKKIEVLEIFETEHHIKVESWMHKIHRQKRMEGEWFELTDEDVKHFKQDCQKGHDMFKMLIDSGNPFI
jgi:hypothetical protein